MGTGDKVPVLATSAEAIDDLIKYDSYEQESGDHCGEGMSLA